MSEEQLNQSIPEPSQSPTPEVDSPATSAPTGSKTQNASSAVPKNQRINALIASIGNLGKKGKKLAAEPPLQLAKSRSPPPLLTQQQQLLRLLLRKLTASPQKWL